MENTFIKFLKEQRRRFSNVVSFYGVGEHKILRTESDSLLVAYDQAIDYVEKTASGKNIKELAESLNNAGGFIEQMYHTIGSFESDDYHSFLEDITDQGDQLDISNAITDDIVDEYYDAKELHQMMVDFNIFGFVAEIGAAERSNFRFDEEGNFQSCSVMYGITISRYVFSETIEGLFKKAIEVVEKHKKEAIENARKELKTTGA